MSDRADHDNYVKPIYMLVDEWNEWYLDQSWPVDVDWRAQFTEFCEENDLAPDIVAQLESALLKDLNENSK